jgi:hypothetical protein
MDDRAPGPRFPCPCCGHLVFDGPPGSYQICPICWWEDDALQLEFATTLGGGANRPTLLEAQRSFLEIGACEASALGHVRTVSPADRRDPTWRPIDPVLDSFAGWGSPARDRAPVHDDRLYYWRPTSWRRRPS